MLLLPSQRAQQPSTTGLLTPMPSPLKPRFPVKHQGPKLSPSRTSTINAEFTHIYLKGA